ncbi:hypothetical protein LCGC14_0913010 [marine sediment metagenome]|uniref:Uncharacterized protein n=1 Tax=marine sediment metagenome TaxID=412755 RepID=A0A0F9NXN2_9ZZZZ
MGLSLKSGVAIDRRTKKRIFKCNLKEKTLKKCIFSRLKNNKIELFIKNPQNIINEEILNCLNTGLNSCLHNHLKNKEFTTEAKVSVSLNDENSWKIDEIDVSVILFVKDIELVKYINNCLKFFRESCDLPKNINFFAINRFEVDDLQSYKKGISHLVQQLHNISSKKKIQNRLYSLLRSVFV